MHFHTLFDNLKKLNLPANDFVVVSSGAMSIRGIRDSKDLDVIVTEKLWNKLEKKFKVVKNDWDIDTLVLDSDIEILNPKQSLYSNSGEISEQEIFDKADIFDGIKFINLEHLKTIKLKMGREKDLEDIALIEKFQSSVTDTI